MLGKISGKFDGLYSDSNDYFSVTTLRSIWVFEISRID